MTQNLRIGTMRLELECASASQERRVLDLIRSTIDTGILNALDHRLASCLPMEGVHRIDSLEIDLGTISEADLCRDLGDRLVRALEPELMRRIPAYVPEQPSLQAWTALGERLSSRELVRQLDQGELMALVASRKDAVLDRVSCLVDLADQGKLGALSPTVLDSLWEILLDAALDVCRMDDVWRSRIEAALGVAWTQLQERLSSADAKDVTIGQNAMETRTDPVIHASIGSRGSVLASEPEGTGNSGSNSASADAPVRDASLAIEAETSGLDLANASVSSAHDGCDHAVGVDSSRNPEPSGLSSLSGQDLSSREDTEELKGPGASDADRTRSDMESDVERGFSRRRLLELALERGDAPCLESLIPFVSSDVAVLHAVLMRSRLDQRLRRRLGDLPLSVLDSMAAVAASPPRDEDTSVSAISLRTLVEKLLGAEGHVKEQGSIAIAAGISREDGMTGFASLDEDALGSEYSRAQLLMQALESGNALHLTGLAPFVPSDAGAFRAVLLRSQIDRRLRRRLRDLPEEIMEGIVASLPKAERKTALSIGMSQVDFPLLDGDVPSDPPSEAVSERMNMTETAEFGEACDPCDAKERGDASDVVDPMRLLKALVSVLDGSASANILPLGIEDALKTILLEKECRNALLRLLLVSELILRRLAEVASEEDWHALMAARHGSGLEVLESCRSRVLDALGQVLSGAQAPILEISWRMCLMQHPVLDAGAAPMRICRDLLMVLGRKNPALPVAKALSVLERQLARERPDLFLEEAWKKARAAASTRGAGIAGVAVDNAGLVILGPYLPRLFGMLSVLGEDGFVDLGAKIHAVRVLQFLIHGSTAARQESLPLCRILCGLPSGVPVGEEPIPLQEQEACEQLLEAVIQHWSILGSTSVSGLRETFLRRNGVLESQEQQWLLRVEAGAFDMLLDKLPWGYKTVRFGWMDKTLQVEWR